MKTLRYRYRLIHLMAVVCNGLSLLLMTIALTGTSAEEIIPPSSIQIKNENKYNNYMDWNGDKDRKIGEVGRYHDMMSRRRRVDNNIAGDEESVPTVVSYPPFDVTVTKVAPLGLVLG